MGTTNKTFIKLQESANGRVSVKLQKNNFGRAVHLQHAEHS